MPVISIYNNKGGVGKSTLTVGLAEFLAANRKKSVLVIDLDAQASSSGAILGGPEVDRAITNQQTIAALAAQVLRERKAPTNLGDFLTYRQAGTGRGMALAELALLVPDKAAGFDLEEQMRDRDLLALRDYLKPALEGFDFVLIDLPGNLNKRDKLAVAALVMSDFVLIPIEPSQISLNALPETFKFVKDAQAVGRSERPAIVGLVLNKVDKRTEPYRERVKPILERAEKGLLPPVFDNVIPDTPKLATATDEHQNFNTLKERFDTYYDHMRKVAQELDECCAEHRFDHPNGAASGYISTILDVFNTFRLRRWASKAGGAGRR